MVAQMILMAALYGNDEGDEVGAASGEAEGEAETISPTSPGGNGDFPSSTGQDSPSD